VGCYIWYSEEGPGRALLAVPNVTAHPSTASVGLPITVLLYNSQFLCSFNVGIKELMHRPIGQMHPPTPITGGGGNGQLVQATLAANTHHEAQFEIISIWKKQQKQQQQETAN